MIKENDVVIAKRNLSNAIMKGCKGVVVMKYLKPRLGYEVEFVDKNNETLDVMTVYPDDIEKLQR